MGAEVGNLLVTAGDEKMIIWDGIKEGNLVLAEASPGSAWKELARVNGVLKKSTYEAKCQSSLLTQWELLLGLVFSGGWAVQEI